MNEIVRSQPATPIENNHNSPESLSMKNHLFVVRDAAGDVSIYRDIDDEVYDHIYIHLDTKEYLPYRINKPAEVVVNWARIQTAHAPDERRRYKEIRLQPNHDQTITTDAKFMNQPEALETLELAKQGVADFIAFFSSDCQQQERFANRIIDELAVYKPFRHIKQHSIEDNEFTRKDSVPEITEAPDYMYKVLTKWFMLNTQETDKDSYNPAQSLKTVVHLPQYSRAVVDNDQ